MSQAPAQAYEAPKSELFILVRDPLVEPKYFCGVKKRRDGNWAPMFCVVQSLAQRMHISLAQAWAEFLSPGHHLQPVPSPVELSTRKQSVGGGRVVSGGVEIIGGT